MTYRVGIDVGGTFTDFAAQDEGTGEVTIHKTLTTPQDPSTGVIQGLEQLLKRHGMQFDDVTHIVHGTTLASNTIIERKGEKAGLITTRGFRDVLELGRQKRYELYDLFIRKPVPLIPRALIMEIGERQAYDGKVLVAPDEGESRAVVQRLLDLGVKSIAVCFLHSYANPQNEKMVESIIKDMAPDIPVSLSSDISPLYREYERTQTTVVNAYIIAKVRDYLRRMRDDLSSRGFNGILHIMQSAGGITTAETMERYPVRMIESGPAAGALMTAFYGQLSGYEDLISFDMGGTTAKMCLVEKGKPGTTNEFEIAQLQLKPGSGLVINVPAIDLVEIGAGGGSIAQVRYGLIAVGPESSGADPGPMCYGRGGTEPTVTDADLILGYLNPDYFLGGEVKLGKEAALRGIKQKIAEPLGISVTQAAWGIHEIVNANMERATRLVSIERGHDPRRFTFVAFGGAGPIHGPRIAKSLGAARVMIPSAAGVTSALGLLSADIRFDLARTYVWKLDRQGHERIDDIYQELEEVGGQMLLESKARGDFVMIRSADMRYVGQGHEINVPLPSGRLSAEDLPKIEETFNQVYARRYGYSDPGEPIEAITWKLTAYCAGQKLALKKLESQDRASEEALKGYRPAYFPEFGDFVECPVYDRYRLFPSASLRGPAIVEERESTVVIVPDQEAQVDGYGNLIIQVRT